MKQELLDLYLDAIRCDDQSSIKSYHDARARIAPSIVMDLILKEIELKETLKDMAEALLIAKDIINRYANNNKRIAGYSNIEDALQKYHEQEGSSE